MWNWHPCGLKYPTTRWNVSHKGRGCDFRVSLPKRKLGWISWIKHSATKTIWNSWRLKSSPGWKSSFTSENTFLWIWVHHQWIFFFFKLYPRPFPTQILAGSQMNVYYKSTDTYWVQAKMFQWLTTIGWKSSLIFFIGFVWIWFPTGNF